MSSSEGKDTSLDQTPWPAPGDSLFQEGNEAWDNGRLDWGRDRWEIYATAYQKAAEILAERVQYSDFPADFLIYPMAYLYRHYLELRLKELIKSGREFLGEPPDVPQGHRLSTLWISCRKVLERALPELLAVDLDVVEGCIRDLCGRDPQSQSFRYPTTTQGQPALAGMGAVSVANLREVMERVSSLLEGSSSAIAEYSKAG